VKVADKEDVGVVAVIAGGSVGYTRVVDAFFRCDCGCDGVDFVDSIGHYLFPFPSLQEALILFPFRLPLVAWDFSPSFSL